MYREPNIHDSDYIDTLPRLYKRTYSSWKERMLKQVDSIADSMRMHGVEATMTMFSLSPRDVALLVRLGYFTEQETEEFGLAAIEQSVPL